MSFKKYKNECCRVLQFLCRKKGIGGAGSRSVKQSLSSAAGNCCSIIRAGWRDGVSISTLVGILVYYVREDVFEIQEQH